MLKRMLPWIRYFGIINVVISFAGLWLYFEAWQLRVIFLLLALILGLYFLATYWVKQGKVLASIYLITGALTLLAISLAILIQDFLVVYAIFAVLITLFVGVLISVEQATFSLLGLVVLGMLLAIQANRPLLSNLSFDLMPTAVHTIEVVMFILSAFMGMRIIAFKEEGNSTILSQLTSQTKELQATNKQLRWEMYERQRTQHELADLNLTLEQQMHDLEQANEQLQELERLKTKLINDISHELRTPLASIQLNLDLLERGKRENYDTYLQRLREKTAQLTQLVVGIMQLSQLEMSSIASVDLNAIVEMVLNEFAANLEQSNLSVNFSPAADLSRIHANQAQIHLAIWQLIKNAIDYSADGEIEITSWQDAEAQRVYLRVQDQGMGIQPDELPLIFGRFYRGQAVSQLTHPGAGIGLTLVKEIIALHSGEVTVESQPEEGATFTISLPITPIKKLHKADAE